MCSAFTDSVDGRRVRCIDKGIWVESDVGQPDTLHANAEEGVYLVFLDLDP
jgi:hypothetical protein